MVFPLFVLFAVMPIVEIYVLMEVGSALGVGVTIGIVLLTAALGASLVRSQGLSTLMSVQSRLNQGEIPGLQIMEGVLLAVAGVLLVTPGFVTDFFGLLILTPFTRKIIAGALLKRVKLQSVGAGQAGFGAQFGQSPFGQQGPFGGQGPFDGQDGNTFDHEGDSHTPYGRDKQLEKDSKIIDADYQRKD
ncbi:FxsA family protein [Ferrimonas lipolytica]|uniref:FxsA family protein n=1 Tax=Ferrimonas lipolytica TaxID=2724191 RepID=A0A6H1UK07_9GAMM|nr:FxsA family protein [Ferrimonas lipolytica]QIZ78959.1 FxsA family protein [Ferrimonas lipolytica]